MSDAESLFNRLYEAYAEFGKANWYRLDRAHWVMDLAAYKQLRAASGRDDDGDPDEWVPGPGDMLLGMPITVTDDGGQAHLVIDEPDMPQGIQQALARAGGYVMGGMSHFGALGLAAAEMTRNPPPAQEIAPPE